MAERLFGELTGSLQVHLRCEYFKSFNATYLDSREALRRLKFRHKALVHLIAVLASLRLLITRHPTGYRILLYIHNLG